MTADQEAKLDRLLAAAERLLAVFEEVRPLLPEPGTLKAKLVRRQVAARIGEGNW